MKTSLLLSSRATSAAVTCRGRSGLAVGTRYVRQLPQTFKSRRVIVLEAAGVEEPQTTKAVEADGLAATPETPSGRSGRYQGQDRRGSGRPPSQRRGPKKEVTHPYKDIELGQVLEARVDRIMEFGCFVDIGCEINGLIHISQLKDGYVANVSEVVKVGDNVKARVVSKQPGDTVEKSKISLTLRLHDTKFAPPGAPRPEGTERSGDSRPPPRGKTATRRAPGKERSAKQVNSKVGDEIEGKIIEVKSWGAFVDLGNGDTGLLHYTKIFMESGDNVDDARDLLSLGETVKVRVESIDAKQGRLALTMKTAEAMEADKAFAEKLQSAREVPAGLKASIMGSALARAGIAKSSFVDLTKEPEPVKASEEVPKDAAEAAAAPVDIAPEVEPKHVEEPPVPEPEPVKAAAPVVEEAAPAPEPVVEEPAPVREPEPVKAAAPVVEEAAPPPEPVVEEPAPAPEPEPVKAAAPVVEEVAPAPEPVVEEPAPAPEPEPVKAAAPVVEEAAPAPEPVVEEPAPAPEPEPVKAAAPVVEEAARTPEPVVEEPAPAPEPEPVKAAAPVVEEPVKEEVAAPAPEPVKEEPVPAPAPTPTPEPIQAAAATAPPPEVKADAGGISAKLVKELREKTGGGMMDCKKALVECNGDLDKAAEYLRKKGLVSAEKKASRVAAEGIVASYIHPGSRLGVLVEVNCETDFVARGEKFRSLVADVAMQIAACPEVVVVDVADVPPELKAKETDIEMQKEDILSKPEAIRPKIVEGRIAKTLKTWALLEQPFVKDGDKTVAEIVKEAVASIGENIQIRRFSRYQLGEGIEKKVADLAKDVEEQTKAFEAAAAAKAAAAEAAPAEEAAPEAASSAPAIEIPAKLVKQLRDQSGAGMMDCKKALAACGGDIQAATDYLRKKGITSADKKAGRVAAEGAIGSYVHAGSQLGVLVEVNCETDFVARGEKFKQLVQDLAMQIAACPEVSVVAIEDVPADELENERRIEMEKEDIKSKPEAIRGKIVDGRVAKIAKERALLEQPFVKDTNKTVAEVIKESIATIGENIKVRRFTRYKLGEGIQKKVSDFAAEVAAQTGGIA
eukprot:jgi/Botrbrau1/22620/Bobra.176_1s0049.1